MMRASLRRMWAMSAKEVRHVLRDPSTLSLALAMPLAMLLLFGYGVNFDLDRLPLTFVDLDDSSSSRSLRRRLCAGDQFDDAGLVSSTVEAERRLVTGQALAALVIPSGFEADLRKLQTAKLQLLLDGSDSSSAVQMEAKVHAAVLVLGMSLAQPRAATGTSTPPIEVRTWMQFNPDGRSAVYLVPGITALVLTIVAVLLTALTVSREWERGSMVQLFATPVGRLEILLGKLLPYILLGTLAVLLVLAVGAWVFEIPFRGSASALALLSLLFLAGMLAQGLLVSVTSRTQMLATQLAAMSSLLPGVLLSGFVFPIENMPKLLQWFTLLIPARYYIEGLRGVLLRGNGLQELWPEALALGVFTILMIALGTASFRRTIA